MKITRLPSGAYSVNAYAAGVRKRFTGKDKKEVQLKAAAWINANKSQRRRGLFSEAAAQFLADKTGDLSPSTLAAYYSIDRTLRSKYPEIYYSECISITDDDLQDMIDDLSENHSPKTVSNYIGFVSSVFTHHKIRIPVIELPRRDHKELNIPDEFTVKRIMKAALDRGDEDMWLCIALAAGGPLRRGEICALGRTDRVGLPKDAPDPDPLAFIDFDGGTIHVAQNMARTPDNEWILKAPKTPTSNRTLTMSGKIMGAIRRRGYVTNLNPNEITNRFERLLKREGVAPFRFHDLRHYCASYLHAKGYPDAYIQMRTGHASAEILRNVYTHVLTDERKKIDSEMVKDLDELIV